MWIKSQLRTLGNPKQHFWVKSRKITVTEVTKNEMKAWWAEFLAKGKRLVKVHDLDCDVIRMLQQNIFRNSKKKYINAREKMQFAIDSLFGREITFYYNS